MRSQKQARKPVRSKLGPLAGSMAGVRSRGGRGGPRLPLMRGGGWDNPAQFVRASARYHYYGPTLKVSDIGFRVVREAK